LFKNSSTGSFPLLGSIPPGLLLAS
jgi:hypothetical protein